MKKLLRTLVFWLLGLEEHVECINMPSSESIVAGKLEFKRWIATKEFTQEQEFVSKVKQITT